MPGLQCLYCSVPISSLIDAWIAVFQRHHLLMPGLQCSNFITYWCLDYSVPMASLIDAWIAVSGLQCSNFITYWCLDYSVPTASLIDAWITVFQWHHLLMPGLQCSHGITYWCLVHYDDNSTVWVKFQVVVVHILGNDTDPKQTHIRV